MPKSPSASDRARRLIALLGHLSPGNPLALSELASKVGASPAELAHDLSVLSLCGVAPYSPEQMVDVFVEDGVVEVYSPLPAVSGPVRLSPAEAGALASALGAAGFTASDPLSARLLAASSAAFDADALERTLRSSIATHDSVVFETLASATHERECVALSYQRDGAEIASVRVIEPLRLFSERGAWYVSAWCRLAEELRTFRIDRIRSAAVTGERFDADAHPAAASASPRETHVAFSTDGLPLARLRFSPGEVFVEREWPGGRVVESSSDGSCIAEVPIGGPAWIARRVAARLGAVEALTPAEARHAVVATAMATLAEG
jgi:proteasome accessory factor C